MSLLTLVYQLDTTGTNPDNKITDEVHTLSTKRVRTIAPIHNPFFKDSVVIKDTANNRILQDTEYRFYSLQQLASAKYGKEIYNIVLITNTSVSSNISITYQTLGGEYNRSFDGIKELIEQLYDDNRPVSWPNISDVPESFDPLLHLHNVNDLIGFEYVVAALERLRTVTMTKALLLADDVLKIYDAKLQDLIDNSGSGGSGGDGGGVGPESEFTLHVRSLLNPHNTTKTQVGLGNILNYESTIDASDIKLANINNPKYVTNYTAQDYLNDEFTNLNNLCLKINEATQITTDINNINDKIELYQEALEAIADINININRLDNLYNPLYDKVTEIETNLTSAKTRSDALIAQYLP